MRLIPKQLLANPKAEICAFKDGEWIRIAADDGNTQVFYIKNAKATISSFTHEPEIIEF